jgi:hypothetical protein
MDLSVDDQHFVPLLRRARTGCSRKPAPNASLDEMNRPSCFVTRRCEVKLLATLGRNQP